METRQFVTLMAKHAINDTVDSLLRVLAEPIQRLPSRTGQPTSEAVVEKKRSEWFHRLSHDDRETLADILRYCAELSLFSVFAAIDGVSFDFKDDLELIAIDSTGQRTLINSTKVDPLHDMLSNVLLEQAELAKMHNQDSSSSSK